MSYPVSPSFRWLTVGGLGRMRPASGTWGSMPPVILAAAMLACNLGPSQSPWVYNGILAAIALAFTAACVLQGSHAEAVMGKDPSDVVADEVAGQSLTLLFLPLGAAGTPIHAGIMLFAAFIAFRLLDIIKPWPAKQIQAVPGGLGIVLDDLVAGIYAWGAIQLVAWLV